MKTHKKTKIIITAAALAALLVCIVSGCARQEAAGGKAAKALKRFDVAYQTTAYSTVLFPIAKEEGFYAEEGLDVILTPANTSSNLDAYSALTSGKTKVTAGGGSVTPIKLIEDGSGGIVIIGGIMTENAALIARPENASYWKEFTAATLTGKTVATRRTGTGDIAFRGYLLQRGIDLSKIKFVELDGFATIIEAVNKGEADLGIVSTIWRKTAETRGLPVVKQLDELEPHFICCRIATTRDYINAGRDEFVALLKGNIKAYRIFKTDLTKTLKYAVKYYQIAEDVLKSELYEYGHMGISPDPGKKWVQDFYNKMTLIGITKGGGPVADNVDTTIYEDALAQVLSEYPNDPVFLELKKEFDENNK
jgi:NitT/TauT family transport system substrate-binding protein